MNKAVFFDRDGVLNRDCHLISSIDQVEVIEETAAVIAHAKENGFHTFVVTNQTVVSRGLATEEEVATINKYILKKMQEINPKAIIDKVYSCPFHPDAQVERYRKQSDLRKPAPGMLLQAKEEFSIDLEKSYMIGDRPSDIAAGNLAGCTSVLLQSGEHEAPLIKSNNKLSQNYMTPNHIVSDPLSICELIK